MIKLPRKLLQVFDWASPSPRSSYPRLSASGLEDSGAALLRRWVEKCAYEEDV